MYCVPPYSAEAKNAWAYTRTSIPSAPREDLTLHNSDNTVTLVAWLLCLQPELEREIFLFSEINNNIYLTAIGFSPGDSRF